MDILVDTKTLRITRDILGPYDTNVYVLLDRRSGNSVIIDAPYAPERIIAMLKGTHPKVILLTHGHPDHIGALKELRQQLNLPLYAHAADTSDYIPPPERFLDDSDVISLGSIEVNVIAAPGHTAGGLCFLVEGYLFGGDTIFPGGPGFTAAPVHFKTLLYTITSKLFTLPEATIVLPGHGEGVTIGDAKHEYESFSARQHDDNLCGDVLWASS